MTVDAVQLILARQLLPAIRAAVNDLGGDGPGTLVHLRPTAEGSGWPTNSAAALVHHLCGVVSSWGAACLGGEKITRDRAAEFAFSGPVGHILHDVATHVGHLELTRDVLLSRGRAR